MGCIFKNECSVDYHLFVKLTYASLSNPKKGFLIHCEIEYIPYHRQILSWHCFCFVTPNSLSFSRTAFLFFCIVRIMFSAKYRFLILDKGFFIGLVFVVQTKCFSTGWLLKGVLCDFSIFLSQIFLLKVCYLVCVLNVVKSIVIFMLSISFDLKTKKLYR